MKDARGLWQYAEQCLYYSYARNFNIVGPVLDRISKEGSGKDFETWGRISALAAMEQRMNFDAFLEQLEILKNNNAWRGAATVWTNTKNFRKHYQQCIHGITVGLNTSESCREIVASEMEHIFDYRDASVTVPLPLIQKCFSIFEMQPQSHGRLHGLHEWLNAVSLLDPVYALSATEIYLAYIEKNQPHFYDYHDNLMQLMTRLFSEAEEREESDNGEMLRRVVAIQDTLMSLGLDTLLDWLKSAERP
jgi:hypothetical protein